MLHAGNNIITCSSNILTPVNAVAFIQAAANKLFRNSWPMLKMKQALEAVLNDKT